MDHIVALFIFGEPAHYSVHESRQPFKILVVIPYTRWQEEEEGLDVTLLHH